VASLIPELLQTLPVMVPAAAPTLKKTQGKGNLRYVLADPNSTAPERLQRLETQSRAMGGGTLAKSVLNMLDGPDDSIERLAFERDPQRINEFAGVYRPKLQLLPDALLKRIAIQDDLVASAVHARSNHISQFGRKQVDRHQKGFKFEVDASIAERLDEDGEKKLQQRIDRAERLLLTCGHTKGWAEQDKCSFAEYLYMQARYAVVVGRMATEVVRVPDPEDPGNEDKLRFHSFRPVDAGTIYYSAPYHEANDQVRKAALRLLETLKNEKLQPEKFENEEYAWVQVIEGRPVQAFGPKELLVHNFYPVTDIELQGYPLTPLDTAIAAVTTHLNITNHNRLYFQHGRAARGMLIIKSADVDAEVVAAVKQQFNASINAVQNAWRMPVFGIGPEDDLTWAPIDSGARDMEFQYLSDQNARTILAAFSMSPEEIPGYQHLSRGTNNQSLSESNEEYKLTAARDVGIRPLIAWFEDFLNASIVPLIDPELAKVCKLRLIGLDVDTEEKESIRISQDAPLHMTYNDILQKVEKKPLPKHTGADIPLNPTFFQYAQSFMTFGQFLETFCGVEGASQHPDKQFYQNPFWFQNQQMMQAAQQAQMQAQQAQPGQPGQPPPDGGGSPSPGGGQPAPDQGGDDLGSGIDQVIEALARSELSKGERMSLPQAKKLLRARHKAATRAIMSAWKDESRATVASIAELADRIKPRA
jgi:hypothetical protein